ncbi:MAG: DUF1043 family protein [Pseudomonadota bacterium]
MISLDVTTSIWLTGLLSVVLGAAIGSIATYLVVARHGRTRKLQDELDHLKERFTDYRDQVTQHFMRTSELVQEMTQSYRAVYEHLASGAQNLCGGQLETSHKNDASASALASDGTDTPELTDEHMETDVMTGDMPRISDLDIKADAKIKQPVQH